MSRQSVVAEQTDGSDANPTGDPTPGHIRDAAIAYSNSLWLLRQTEAIARRILSAYWTAMCASDLGRAEISTGRETQHFEKAKDATYGVEGLQDRQHLISRIATAEASVGLIDAALCTIAPLDDSPTKVKAQAAIAASMALRGRLAEAVKLCSEIQDRAALENRILELAHLEVLSFRERNVPLILALLDGREIFETSWGELSRAYSRYFFRDEANERHLKALEFWIEDRLHTSQNADFIKKLLSGSLDVAAALAREPSPPVLKAMRCALVAAVEALGGIAPQETIGHAIEEDPERPLTAQVHGEALSRVVVSGMKKWKEMEDLR